MPTFDLGDDQFEAENVIDGILINPILPKRFDSTPNESRPDSHEKFWYRPYILTGDGQIVLRCYDGGAWDRSTNWGVFNTIEEAVKAGRKKQYNPHMLTLLHTLGEPYNLLALGDRTVAMIPKDHPDPDGVKAAYLEDFRKRLGITDPALE